MRSMPARRIGAGGGLPEESRRRQQRVQGHHAAKGQRTSPPAQRPLRRPLRWAVTMAVIRPAPRRARPSAPSALFCGPSCPLSLSVIRSFLRRDCIAVVTSRRPRLSIRASCEELLKRMWGGGEGRKWRRGRDSNPRGRLTPPTRFPVASLSQLGHLSAGRGRTRRADEQYTTGSSGGVPSPAPGPAESRRPAGAPASARPSLPVRVQDPLGHEEQLTTTARRRDRRRS